MDDNEKRDEVILEHDEDQTVTHLTGHDHEFAVPKGYWYSYRFIGSIAAIVLLANNLFIGYLMPVNILSVIDADLGPDPNVYLVTLLTTLIQGVGLLLVGSLSDIIGRRWFMIGGQTLGFIGACIAARANSITEVIGATVFIGIGGATQTLYPLLIHELVPNKYRGFAQGAISISVFPTLGLGPAFARMIVQYTALGWRWVYWLHAIIAALSAFLFMFCYHPPGFRELNAGISKIQKLKQIDYIGFGLYAGGLVCLLLGLTWGGNEHPWKSASVIAPLIIGVVVLVIFGFYEVYIPKAPLFPMTLFKIRSYTVAVIVGSVGQMAFYALNVLWPQQITSLYTTDNIKIGWMSCTTGAALTIGEFMGSPICKKGMKIKIQLIASIVGLTLFLGIMSMSDAHEEHLALGMTIVVGLFVGWVELITIVIAGLVIPPENIGAGQAFFASTRAVSGTIVTSIYVAIQTNVLSSDLPKRVTQAAETAGLNASSIPDLLSAISGGTSLTNVTGVTTTIAATVETAVLKAYSKSYSTTYLSSLAWGGLALICCFFATNDIDNYFTAFLNKTVDAPHIEALEKDLETGKVQAEDE